MSFKYFKNSVSQPGQKQSVSRPLSTKMAEWAAIYASLPSKNVQPVDEYAGARHHPRHLRLPRPNRPEISSICVEIESEASTSEDEEFGNHGNVSGGTSFRSRGGPTPGYANNTYLKPPPSIRQQNQRHYVQQRHQQATYSTNHFQATHTERHPNQPNRHRSPSLPPIYRTPNPSPAELPVRSASSAKPRKHRPTPLELVPRFQGSQLEDKVAVPSPYSPGILSLYSPEPTLSPQSRTRSLPIYTFRACDLPSPSTGVISIPSPLLENDRSPQSSTTSFSSIFSPGISPGSIDSGRTSLSPNEMASKHRFRHYI